MADEAHGALRGPQLTELVQTAVEQALGRYSEYWAGTSQSLVDAVRQELGHIEHALERNAQRADRAGLLEVIRLIDARRAPEPEHVVLLDHVPDVVLPAEVAPDVVLPAEVGPDMVLLPAEACPAPAVEPSAPERVDARVGAGPMCPAQAAQAAPAERPAQEPLPPWRAEVCSNWDVLSSGLASLSPGELSMTPSQELSLGEVICPSYGELSLGEVSSRPSWSESGALSSAL